MSDGSENPVLAVTERTPPVGGSQILLDNVDSPGHEDRPAELLGRHFNYSCWNWNTPSPLLACLTWLPSQCLFDKEIWHPCMCVLAYLWMCVLHSLFPLPLLSSLPNISIQECWQICEIFFSSACSFVVGLLTLSNNGRNEWIFTIMYDIISLLNIDEHEQL